VDEGLEAVNRDGKAGVMTPFDQIVVREVNGYPVVVRYVAWRRKQVWAHWSRVRGVESAREVRWVR
jgi:hypothetical protein